MKRLDDYPTHEICGLKYRCGRVKPFGASLVGEDSFIYCAVNAHWEKHIIGLPIIPRGMKWNVVAYSADDKHTGLNVKDYVDLMPRSIMLLIGKKQKRKKKTDQ